MIDIWLVVIEGGISVVIPVRDRPNQLKRALFSLLPQMDMIREVLIIADGSAQQLTGVFDMFRRLGGSGKLLTNTHRPGAPGARNTGIEIAQCEFISFLDSDDVWLPHHLQSAMSCFEQNPALIGVSADFIAAESNNRRQPHSRLGSINDLALLLRLGHGDPTTSALTVRRSESPTYFDENLVALQDYDYLLQLSCLGDLASSGSATVVKYTEGQRVWNPRRAARARQYLWGKWATELDHVALARTFQRWHFSYEQALIQAGEFDVGFLFTLRRHALKLRSRLVRDMVGLLRNIPI